ncbi:Xaa-Pro peptidase family protein [Thermoactinomyces sp. DSM 45892]|uniref:M24 family metallopeptidase n=1 Tax=Thermoactinomyces sp. DSM 45892 TaxID=1882753 RepID=UPI000895800D|nr:Xaa-Pro peptidase family protein [Thermoactinomyces sp. DSM 45892]SDY00511.1 Xaa-Pro aminopeptidase [Thermoactinomyces sp. DSM 45892]
MEKRLASLRRKMMSQGIEVYLITNPYNRRYITGFTGSSGVAIVTERDAVFITDFRYIDQVKAECPHFRLELQSSLDIWHTVRENLKKIGLKKVSFEATHMTFAQFQALSQGDSSIEYIPAAQIIEELRMVKRDEELTIIRHAAMIADRTFEQIIQYIQPGLKESEVQLRLKVLMMEMGATGPSFDIIVASGWRGALPHGVASEKVIEKGDLVTLDFGAAYQGYVSDLTRTVMVGKPNEKQKEIYDIVLEAERKAVDALRPGMTGMEADAVARDLITERGYGAHFGHGTGHGIGLEVHEGPRLSQAGSLVLKPGNVVTVEPGIYLSDFGGVRIEDDVLITESGHEVLTQCTKELIIL